MKKFLVLYRSSASAREQMAKATPEMHKAGMDAWLSWMKKAGKAIVDFGAPVSPVGPASPSVGGYSILQAESAKQLAALLEDHPHRMAPDGSIEVHEFLPMPGM